MPVETKYRNSRYATSEMKDKHVLKPTGRLRNKVTTAVAVALTPFLPRISRASTTTITVVPTETQILRHDKIDEIEVDTACYAGQFADHSKYAGPRMTIDEQLAVKVSGKGLRFVNSCLMRTSEEVERFVSERMRDDV